MKKVEDYVRNIPDFPEKGIIFRDITSVIQSPEGLKLAIDGMNDLLKDVDYDIVAGQNHEALYLVYQLHMLTARVLFQ